ncbi:MAG: radical SAM protein [Vulcanimicrobiota bacterium]
MIRKSPFEKEGIWHATVNNHRLHMRIQKKGQNLLWIDGRQPPLILDHTATDFMKFIIEGMWKFQQGQGNESDKVTDYVVEQMFRKYRNPLAFGKNRVSRDKIKKDLDTFFGTLMELAEGACPMETGLQLQQKNIDYASWEAPARMDLALTYRCNLECGKCYLNQTETEELDTDKWKEIYAVLWKIGVAQVVFTGGEPLLRKDIVELVSSADKFVTGLITNGTLLEELAESLKYASLDYLQITVESKDASIHNKMCGVEGAHAKTLAGIKSALKNQIQVVTNTTLTQFNRDSFLDTMKWLKETGINNISCNTLICSGQGTHYKREYGLSDEELNKLMKDACQLAGELGVNFQWYSPTCYSSFNPLDFKLGIKTCSAATHNMTVQPDGTVIPCQSWPETVGNILQKPWEKIWNDPICKKLRERRILPDECKGCFYQYTCSGGCPLDESPRTRVNFSATTGGDKNE